MKYYVNVYPELGEMWLSNENESDGIAVECIFDSEDYIEAYKYMIDFSEIPQYTCKVLCERPISGVKND